MTICSIPKKQPNINIEASMETSSIPSGHQPWIGAFQVLKISKNHVKSPRNNACSMNITYLVYFPSSHGWWHRRLPILLGSTLAASEPGIDFGEAATALDQDWLGWKLWKRSHGSMAWWSCIWYINEGHVSLKPHSMFTGKHGFYHGFYHGFHGIHGSNEVNSWIYNDLYN